ncbi:hypothetical protein [Gracilibacillus alcaliphilus]|uniref:hypothetical protein n=1 Tax=Gracilibacillus alcaliphilus TaxID=1401441 RepID=UPI0019595524|nr:hypothetical protein [Gracilibacillus alcaliphilus]MBM7676517.1 hypothetical protein [Gracilibacillus alcaliphilus]
MQGFQHTKLPDWLQDFLDSEIMDQATYQTIYDFIALDNFRYGEYEGNQYIIRKINQQHIQIEDEITTAHTGVPVVAVFEQKRLLVLLDRYGQQLN